MTTNASLGYSSSFSIQAENSPDNMVDIAEVTNITPPSFSLDQVDVTHMASPNFTREFIPGLIDPGEASLDINFVPGNASDLRIQELMALPISAVRSRQMRITFPNHVTWTFQGIVTGYESSVPVDDKMAATITIKVTGNISTGTT
jgi:Lambda phage tail tube protein, TTP